MRKNKTIDETLIFPNPASHVFTLNIMSYDANTRFEISDIQGKTMISDFIENAQTQIDISSLSKGVYFVKIMGKDQNEVKQLIVN